MPLASKGAEHRVAVLAERDGIVVGYKPADWATEPTPESDRSLVGALGILLGCKRVHAWSRLDVGVSGAVLCSVGSAAHQRVEGLRAKQAIGHDYLGIVHGLLPGQGCWSWPLGRTRDLAGRAIARTAGPAGRSARTHFELIGQAPESSLLRLRLDTGRMHQIRAHAARAATPLVGDRRYGGPAAVCTSTGTVHEVGRIALHSFRIEIEGVLRVEAPLPDSLRELWGLVGGQDSAWTGA
jgi:23S rRNA pseudouridine1911/1915/1917 synthase